MDVLKVESKIAKEGIVIKPIKDDDGYFKVTFGELNTFNKSGKFYRITDIDRYLGPNSLVGKRIENGILIGEDNHPNTDGLDGAGIKRVTIYLDKKNASIHTKAIEVVNTGKIDNHFNLPVYKIYGWVKPIGETKTVLEDLLENSAANVAFSLRSLVRESRIGGIFVRDFLLISTWDTVHSNGVQSATQWNAADKGFEDDMCTVINDADDMKSIIAGFENNENLCEDGQCVINHLKSTLNDSETSIYDW